MPATTNASVTDGPARSAIAAAVRTNKPAPMMAPMPSATSDNGPSVRLSVPSPLASASALSRSIDLVRNSGFTLPPLVETAPRRRRTNAAIIRGSASIPDRPLVWFDRSSPRRRPERFDCRFLEAGRASQQRRPPSQKLLIEILTHDGPGDFGRPGGADRAEHGNLPERSAPESHVVE